MRRLWLYLVVSSLPLWGISVKAVQAQVADSLGVYPGYVVEFPLKGSQVHTTLSQQGLVVKKQVGSLSLVSNRQINSASLSLPTPFDPNDTTCKDLINAGALSCSPNYEIKLNVEPNDSELFKAMGIKQHKR